MIKWKIRLRPSKGLDSRDEPDFISDKITIGEAQSYDNEFGNIEVTLNYAAFTDKARPYHHHH